MGTLTPAELPLPGPAVNVHFKGEHHKHHKLTTRQKKNWLISITQTNLKRRSTASSCRQCQGIALITCHSEAGVSCWREPSAHRLPQPPAAISPAAVTNRLTAAHRLKVTPKALRNYMYAFKKHNQTQSTEVGLVLGE